VAYIEYLSPPVRALQEELVLYHPTLCRVLYNLPDWEDRLAAIATHVDALVDGEYSVKMIDRVIEKLIPLLQAKREVRPGQQVDYKIPGRIQTP
jgi:hypothetical protein